jgi:AcrR family transcriptional regulator
MVILECTGSFRLTDLPTENLDIHGGNESMNRQPDETSEALLAAAHRLLAEAGPDSLTVRRIATEAGMSTMNVYSRFGGKDGVIDELYSDGYRRLIDAISAVPATDDVIGDLERIAQTYRTFAVENPTYYGIMFRKTVHGFHPSDESTVLGLGGLAFLLDRVEAGQNGGVIRRSDEDTSADIAGWLWATCHGLVSLELDGVGNEEVDWPRVFRNGIRRSLNALLPVAEQATIR